MANPNPFLRSPTDDLVDELNAQAAKPIVMPEAPAAPKANSQAAISESTAPRTGSPGKGVNWLPNNDLMPIFESAAQKYNVPVNVVMALANQESRYNPNAVGPETQWGHAKGMMQYLDSTAKGLGINPFDPTQAIPAAAKQIRERLDKGYSMEDAVKEHFAGPDRKLWGEKTDTYGREVMDKVGKIGDALGSGMIVADSTTETSHPAQVDLAQFQKDLDGDESGRYKVLTDDYAATHFSPTLMDRGAYEQAFRQNNPGASDAAVQYAMGEYDKQATQRAATPTVENRFKTLQDPNALFDQRLNQKLAGRGVGVVPALPDMNPAQQQVAQQAQQAQPPAFDAAKADEESGLSAAGSYLGRSLQSGMYDLAGAGARILDAVNPFTLSPGDAAILYKDDPARLKQVQDESAALILDRFAKSMTKNAEESQAAMSDRAKRDYGGLEYATLDQGKAAYRSPVKVIGDAVRSLPSTAAMAVSVYLTRGAALQAEKQALAAGLGEEAARQAAVQAGAKIMANAGAVTEGATGYAQQLNQTVSDVSKVPMSDLAKSPTFQQLLKEGFTPETARAKIIADTSEQAGQIAGIVDATVNKFGGEFLGKILTEGGRLIPRIMKGAANESATEFVQSAGEQVGQNLATQQNVNPNQDLMQGVGEQAVAGAAVGGLMGGATAGAAGRGHVEQAAAQLGAQPATPQKTVAPTAVAPVPAAAAPAPKSATPLTASLENTAEQPQRVIATTPDGQVAAGTVQEYREDGDGNFIAKIVGDDGQVYTVTDEDGVQLVPVEAPKGPLSGALEYAADQHAAEQAPAIEPQAPVGGDQPAPVAEQPAQVAPAAPAAEPAPIVPEKPPVPTSPADMSDDQLRTRMQYLAGQFKGAVDRGVQKKIALERRAIEKEINTRATAQGEANDRRDANVVRNGDERTAGIEAAAQNGSGQPAGRTATQAQPAIEPAAAGKPVSGSGTAVSGADTATNGQPALTDEHTGKEFITDSKARAYIAKNRIGATHYVKRVKPGEFEVRLRPGAGATMDTAASKIAKQEEAVRKAAENLAARKATKSAVPESTDATGKAASWVIRNKDTGEVIAETFDRKKVAALNTAKYEAVPIAEHLAQLNQKATVESPARSLKDFAGRNLGKGWTAFKPASGTLGIARADMPQVKSEHRGPLVNFLNARGIEHEHVEVPAAELKPTQREFSREKVAASQDNAGGERSVLISSDNHVLDGHHQWLAQVGSDEPVKAIRLNAPIRELIDQVREYPSVEQSGGRTNSQQTEANPTIQGERNGIDQRTEQQPNGAEKAAGKQEASQASASKETGKADVLKPKKTYSLEASTPANIKQAKADVQAFVDGDISKRQLINRFAKAKLREGEVSSVTDRIADQWTAADRYAVQRAQGKRVTDEAPELAEAEPRFSVSGDADERDLVITHNLTERNILHADKMGGIAVPSLAVTRKGSPLTNFGEITLIGSKSMADPKGYAKTQVYGADIYSPRYPNVEVELDTKEQKAFTRKFSPMAERMGINLPDTQDLERNGRESLERSPAIMGQFLKDHGIEPGIVMTKPAMDQSRLERLEQFGLAPYLGKTSVFELMDDANFVQRASDEIIDSYRATGDEKMIKRADRMAADAETRHNLARDMAYKIVADAKQQQRPEINKYETQTAMEKQIDGSGLSKQFQKYVVDTLAAMTKSERIFKGFSNSGNRTYTPHTLENVVKILKKELRGGENFNYGVGSLRAHFTPQFKTIAQIKKEKGRLVSAEQFAQVKKEIDAEFDAVSKAMGDPRSETVIAILEDAPKIGLERAAAQFKIDLSQEAKQKAAEFLTRLHHLPTEYFEAKILRDVSLAEFAGAVIPSDTSQEVRDVLQKNGIQTREYESDADRAQAIDSFSQELDAAKGNVLFSVNGNGDIASGIARLMRDKSGEAVVNVPGVGEVTIPYGDAKSGLAHIARRRGENFLSRVADLLEHGKVFEKPGQEGRVFLGYGADEAVLSLSRDGKAGTWLLSAYEKYPDLKSARLSEVTEERMPEGQYFTKGDLYKSLTSRGILGQVIASMVDAGVVKLHGGPNKLPGKARGVRGVQAVTMPDGTIHMVASNLTPKTAFPVLMHEMFHQGGEKLIGTKEWGNLMGRMGSLYRQSEQSGGKAREFYDRARARVEAARRKGAVGKAMEVEEFAAYAIEEYEKSPETLPGAVRKWVEDLIGLVKAWAVQRYGKQLGQVTPAQLAAFARWALMDVAVERRGEIFGPIAERFSQTDAISTQQAASAEPVELTPPEQGRLRSIQAAVQDRMNRVKQVQDRITKLAGRTIGEKADYYLAETLRPGKIAASLEDAQNHLFAPLMERLAKSGFTMEQLSTLLHAQHAEERNAAVAKINPAFADTQSNPGSGMSDSVAQEIIRQHADDKELLDIAQQARDIARATLDLKQAYGMLTAEDHAALSKMYENYVPLKGDGEYGPKIKRAMGHGEREEHILENITRDYQQAVVTGEKNVARQSLLRLVLQNPDPDLWTVGVPPKGRYVAGKVYNVFKGNEQVASFTSQPQVQAFLEAKGNNTGYTVRDSAGEQVKEFTRPLQDNEVMVYVKGDPVRIQIHDEKLARQLRPIIESRDLSRWFVEKMRDLNRFKSNIYTGKNPAFIPRNMARDAMTGTINMTGHHGAKVAAKAWGSYPAAFGAMLQYAATGKMPEGRMGTMLAEYRQQGGKIGASHMSDLEQQGKTLTRMFDDAYGAGGFLRDGRVGKASWIASRKMVGTLAHGIEIANQAAENALRLSLYATLRDGGATPAKAAQAAKTVTVDFDRKGEATGVLGALYLFINPAIQGTANMVRTMATGEHKAQAYALVGALALAGMLTAGANMDDDKDRWLGEEWDTRTKNYIRYIGNHKVTFPLSQEYAPFYAAGAAIAEARRGESAMKSSLRLFSSFIDAYFPLQGAYKADSDNHAADLALSTVPTAVRPHVESAFNRNSFGSQIVPENESTKDRPDNLKMFRGTKGSAYDKAAQGIAAAGEILTGAGKYENDITKVSPETLKYLWRTYTGGLGQFITDSAGLAALMGEDLHQVEAADVPIVKDFYKPQDVKAVRARYYDLAKEAKSAQEEFRQAKKLGDGEAIDKILGDERKAELLGLAKTVTSTNKAAAELADEKVDVLAQDDLSTAQKREKLKAIEQEEEALYRGAIDAFK